MRIPEVFTFNGKQFPWDQIERMEQELLTDPRILASFLEGNKELVRSGWPLYLVVLGYRYSLIPLLLEKYSREQVMATQIELPTGEVIKICAFHLLCERGRVEEVELFLQVGGPELLLVEDQNKVRMRIRSRGIYSPLCLLWPENPS